MTSIYINYLNKDTKKEITYYKEIISKEKEKDELNNYYIVKLEDISKIESEINNLLVVEEELKNNVTVKKNEINNLETKIYNLLY